MLKRPLKESFGGSADMEEVDGQNTRKISLNHTEVIVLPPILL